MQDDSAPEKRDTERHVDNLAANDNDVAMKYDEITKIARKNKLQPWLRFEIRSTFAPDSLPSERISFPNKFRCTLLR